MSDIDLDAENADYYASVPDLITCVRKVVTALNALPKEGEVTAHPRETGRRFNGAVTKAADFFRFLNKVRAPAMGTSFAAVEEGVRTVFSKTYGVSFVEKASRSKDLGPMFDILALPRDALQVPQLAEEQVRAAADRYYNMVAGKSELPGLNRALLIALVQAVDQLAEIKPPQHPDLALINAMAVKEAHTSGPNCPSTLNDVAATDAAVVAEGGPKRGLQKKYVELAIREGVTDANTLTERCGGSAANARKATSKFADYIRIEREKRKRIRKS
jgi:hypothetical protein